MVRIASCNILHGIDVRRLVRGATSLPTDAVDLDAVAEWIAAIDADVVALQEADHHLPRSGGIDQVAWLADRLGYEGTFVPALAGDPDVAWEEAPGHPMPAGIAGYGVGLLSRIGLSAVRRVRLPHGGPGRRRPGARPTNPGVDVEPRVAVTATVGDGLRVSTTHLSYMPWRAVPQLGRAMAASAEGHRGPAVLIGDVNLPRWGGWLALHGRGLHPWAWPQLATRVAGWQHVSATATYPSWRPRVQLDQAFVRNLRRRPRVRVGPAGPSDHLPLVVEL